MGPTPEAQKWVLEEHVGQTLGPRAAPHPEAMSQLQVGPGTRLWRPRHAYLFLWEPLPALVPALCGPCLCRRNVSMAGWGAGASPLTLGLPSLLFPALPLLRQDCSWSNSKSSSRCVRASFCWIAIRNKVFRVFFSSSAAANCLCISSN